MRSARRLRSRRARPPPPRSWALQLVAHAGEAIAPELLERLAQLGDLRGVGPVEATVAFDAHVHESRVAEHLEVLRRGGLAESGAVGDVGGRALLVPDEAEHGAPARVGDGLESFLHDRSLV